MRIPALALYHIPIQLSKGVSPLQLPLALLPILLIGLLLAVVASIIAPFPCPWSILASGVVARRSFDLAQDQVDSFLEYRGSVNS